MYDWNNSDNFICKLQWRMVKCAILNSGWSLWKIYKLLLQILFIAFQPFRLMHLMVKMRFTFIFKISSQLLGSRKWSNIPNLSSIIRAPNYRMVWRVRESREFDSERRAKIFDCAPSIVMNWNIPLKRSVNPPRWTETAARENPRRAILFMSEEICHLPRGCAPDI